VEQRVSEQEKRGCEQIVVHSSSSDHSRGPSSKDDRKRNYHKVLECSEDGEIEC
jgi:hypothetical protein